MKINSLKSTICICLQSYYYYKYKLIDKLSENESRAFILMFHHILDSEQPPCPYSSSVQRFLNIIELLESKGFEFISIDEAICRIKKRNHKRYCVFSFDDGYEDFFINAYPILKQKKIPFVVYITAGFVDKEKHMTSEQIRELSSDPLCTIGAHTMNHPRLRECKDAFKEISTSKYFLEKLTKKNIDHFAYPYGSLIACSRKNIRQVRNNKFKSAVSTIASCLNSLSTYNKYLLPRINGDNFDMK